MEKTFVMIKPDGVKRGLIGDIIKRFEKVGLKIIALKFIEIDREFSKKHYFEHIGKNFYKGLEDFLVSGPVVAMILEGIESIKLVRKIVGGTEPHSSDMGTIRGDYSHITYDRADKTGGQMPNLIHASDNVKNAEIEIDLWFKKNEIFNKYEMAHSKFF